MRRFYFVQTGKTAGKILNSFSNSIGNLFRNRRFILKIFNKTIYRIVCFHITFPKKEESLQLAGITLFF